MLHAQRGNLGTDAGKRPAFLDTHNTVGFLDALDNGVAVQRANGAQVNHFRINPLLRQLLCGLQSLADHDGIRNDCDVLAFALDFCTPNGNNEFLICRHFKTLPVHHFIF